MIAPAEPCGPAGTFRFHPGFRRDELEIDGRCGPGPDRRPAYCVGQMTNTQLAMSITATPAISVR